MEAAEEFHFSPRPNRASEIHWQPWSKEAFDEARTSGRPILLSISAVWCHWCHVMDETTYSHPSVIELINNEYLPVRVDNDVRPDINQRYNMGGWPTTAFLTPTGDILTGATYLPPDQMATALKRVASYYRGNQTEIATRALEARKRAASGAARSAGELQPGLVDEILEAVKNAYDPEYGGFGGSPKFPQTDAILLLLEQAALRADGDLRRMAVHTLEQMTGGGTYDHVEGGFFRYSTTQDWSVPHFEKMLEDHAGLVQALASAGMTAELEKTVGYLDRVLRMAVAYLEAGLDGEKTLDSLFQRAYREGEGMSHTEGVGGQLADQVWSLWAAARAHRLPIALDLAEHMESAYGDPELGGYLDHAAGDDLGRLGDRIKPLAENSVAAMALIELDVLIGDPSSPYRERARRALESVAALPRSYGLMAAAFARALDRLPHGIKVTTTSPALAAAARAAHPYAVIDPDGDQRAVVCVGTICLAPVSTPDAVKDAIKEASQARAPGAL